MPEYDEITIHDLLIRGIVGINKEEREKKQDIVVNLTLFGDLSKACKSDRIEDTVDYKTVKKGVIKIIETSEAFLVEHLAQLIADYCLSHDSIEKVKVSVQKPGALRFARSVGFTITRTRS